jgi:ubiquinone/menaquinone biosynthesis C-methylase UbiE
MSSAAEEWSAVAAAWERDRSTADASSDRDALLLDRVAVSAADRLLELACGPGALGQRWSELVGPGGTVVLSDIAPGMVEVAARVNADIESVSVEVLDAASISRPDESFDVVVCRMGLMFVPEPERAFAEIHRVLAPGGRLAATTWGAIEHNPWITCVALAAASAGIVTGGPPVGPGTIFSLGDPAGVRELVEAAGFADVVVEEQDVMFEAEDVTAHVESVGSRAGALAVALAAATDDQRAEMLRVATELARPYATGDGVAFPGRALVITGHR